MNVNILIKFEDSYGCKTLFEHTKSILNSNKLNVEIVGSLGNTGVFRVPKGEVNCYDYVILVFDMDDVNNVSLTSDELSKHLNKYIMKNGLVKPEYANKVILIPTFFCFESIYLFSKEFQNTIKNIEKLGNRTEHKLVKLYKQYYDYNSLNPENLDNIDNKLSNIKIEAQNIAGSNTSGRWYPQRFHISYSKQLLKILCVNQNKYQGCNVEKIFVKHEDKLFDNLLKYESWFRVEDIVSGLEKQAKFNELFCKLLTLQEVSTLSEMTLENNLKLINDLLDWYNDCIKGKSTERNVNECMSNIESMIQTASGYNLEKIRNACKKSDFSDIEINIALWKLSK